MPTSSFPTFHLPGNPPNDIFIPKPGKDPKYVDSYRPISLISVLGKLLELLCKEIIWDFWEERNIIPQFHHFTLLRSL